MIRRLATATLCLALAAACGPEGHPFAIDPNSPNPFGDGGLADGGADASVDMTVLPDLGPDMTRMGPSCGEIALCTIQCGITNISCSQTCFMGASGESLQEAGALILCAATNCLLGMGGGDGGAGGGGLDLIMCLGMNCMSELSMCEGLIPGGFGGI